MKSKVKRIILLLIIAVILFSASMAMPIFHDSKWREWMQGASLGLMFASIIIIISTVVEYMKVNKPGK